MKLKEIKDEDDIRRINYYLLGKIVSRHYPFPEENPGLIDLEVTRTGNSKDPFLFRFYDNKLVQYFITKLSQANFKRERMKIKYGMKTALIIILFITASLSLSAGLSHADYAADCVNEKVLSENEKTPDYNFLSFPAIEVVDDPHILAISYFNSRLSIIVRENYVTQYEYLSVPYYIYKSFINSPSKNDYYKLCIKNVYESEKIY